MGETWLCANQTAMVAPAVRIGDEACAAPSRSRQSLGGCCSGRHVKVRADGCALHLDCAVCALSARLPGERMSLDGSL
jgi:hypothetical protein